MFVLSQSDFGCRALQLLVAFRKLTVQFSVAFWNSKKHELHEMCVHFKLLFLLKLPCLKFIDTNTTLNVMALAFQLYQAKLNSLWYLVFIFVELGELCIYIHSFWQLDKLMMYHLSFPLQTSLSLGLTKLECPQVLPQSHWLTNSSTLFSPIRVWYGIGFWYYAFATKAIPTSGCRKQSMHWQWSGLGFDSTQVIIFHVWFVFMKVI